MLRNFSNEIAEQGFTGPLGQLMLLAKAAARCLSVTGGLALAAAGGFFASPDNAMMVSLRRARNAPLKERYDSVPEEKWFGR
jgi:hypothetical protein